MNRLSKLLSGVFAFVLLFYHQEPGVNLSLFTFFIWTLVFLSAPPKHRNLHFWILSASCWISCASFAWYGDEISFMALACSTIITAVYAQFPRLNLILYPLVGILNVLSFPFRLFLINRWLPAASCKTNRQKWLAVAIIPFFVLGLFFSIYSTGSDFFSRLLAYIVLPRDFMQIVFLSLLAFFLLFNLWFLWIPKTVMRLNGELKDVDVQPAHSLLPSFTLFEPHWEKKSAEITLIMLNILLIVFIASYNYEQFIATRQVEVLSSAVHDRIATVIVSILLAIGILLYYFRHPAAESKSVNTRIKLLAFIWILLNCLLVLSAFLKNMEYISAYGLTVKRISVCIFLSLCFIGLYVSRLKLKQNKTNTFLINRMAWTFFFTLILTAPINFSRIITTYNLRHQPDQDIRYLQTLRFNQAVLFEKFRDNPSWQSYFDAQKEIFSRERKKSVLSGSLYYLLPSRNKVYNQPAK